MMQLKVYRRGKKKYEEQKKTRTKFEKKIRLNDEIENK